MAEFIKAILFLLFAVIIHRGDSIFTDKPVDKQEHEFVYALDMQKVSTAKLPLLPDAELSNCVQTHCISTSRIQRTHLLEYSISLKALAQIQLLREAALAHHQGRIYDSTTSYYGHPASKYYVFALRRILI